MFISMLNVTPIASRSGTSPRVALRVPEPSMTTCIAGSATMSNNRCGSAAMTLLSETR